MSPKKILDEPTIVSLVFGWGRKDDKPDTYGRAVKVKNCNGWFRRVTIRWRDHTRSNGSNTLPVRAARSGAVSM
jgi:hypothetical protein